jgi:hypothetical protein
MAVTRKLVPYVGLLVVQLIGVALLGWATPLHGGFPLDDAWIHQTAARNLAEQGTLGLVPGHFGSGTTSLLWVVLLAVNHAMLHWPPYAFSAMLGVSLLVAAGQLILHCGIKDGWTVSWAWLFAALFSIGPNHTWFALSGMEVCLGTALLVSAVVLWFEPSASNRTASASGLVMALLVLTRPESGVLCIGVLALARRARRKLGQVVIAALPPALSLVAYLTANLVARAQASPSTLAGRRWMWLADTAHWPWYAPRFELVSHWLDRLWRFSVGEPWLGFFWILVGLACVGALRCWLDAKRIGAIVVLASVQFGTYLVALPVEGHGGRYQPLVAALFLPLSCEGGRLFMEALGHSHAALHRVARHLSWILPAAMGPWLLACFANWSSAHALAVAHVDATEVAAGRWLAQLPREARIASFDMGGITYFGRHTVLDLGGLSDPSVVTDIVQGQIGRRLERERIEYLVLPMSYSDDFPDPWNFRHRLGLIGVANLGLEVVGEFSSPLSIWAPGLQATLHCSPRQSVFHLKNQRQVGP